MISFIKKTVVGLTKTRKKILDVFAGLSGKSYLSEIDIENIEEVLLSSDIGWELTDEVIDALNKADLKEKSVNQRFYDIVTKYLNNVPESSELKRIILLVGVNGTGKTTTIAKLGSYFSQLNKSIFFVASDTYRAAAVEQLRIWAQRLDIDLIANEKSADPASIAYDGVVSGMKKNIDHIIVDTSGRIHNSLNLMKELEKIYKVISKISKEVDVLMTIDANTGQNAIIQVREFIKFIPISGVVLTKMDGSARGGIAIPIMKELNLPVYFMGIGEKVEDLVPFDTNTYLESLFIDKVKS